MEGALLVCLLCLQGTLLVNTLDCAEKGTAQQAEEYRRECVGDDDASKALVSHILPAGVTGLKSQAPSGAVGEPGLVQLAKRGRRNSGPKDKNKRRYGPGAFSTLGITMETVPTKKPPPKELSRQKRHLDREGNRAKKLGYPGGTSVTGQPMRLMMAERSRRQLPHTKPKRKPRVGSFSLLSHRQPQSRQVTRVRRQLTTSQKKSKKKPRLGQYSVLAKPGGKQESVIRVRRQHVCKRRRKKKPKRGQHPVLAEPGSEKEPITMETVPTNKSPVLRVRRQLHDDKRKKKKEPLRGRLSILGDRGPPGQTLRVKRNLPPKKKEKRIGCS